MTLVRSSGSKGVAKGSAEVLGIGGMDATGDDSDGVSNPFGVLCLVPLAFPFGFRLALALALDFVPLAVTAVVIAIRRWGVTSAAACEEDKR